MAGTSRDLASLNDKLFDELDRLNDEDLSGDELAAEISRAKAMSAVSTQIVSSMNVVMRAAELRATSGRGGFSVPKMISGGGEQEDGA